MGLRDRVALVLGGAAGIGLASSRALAAQGASVIIADRDGDAANRAAEALRAAGHTATAETVDASSLPQLRTLIDHVGIVHGKINVLFSNVGAPGPDGFDITEDAFQAALDVNLKNHFFATTYALPLLRSCAPHASVIYMSSLGGLRAGGRSPLYSISKASLLMMMRCFARQLGPDGIRVNALCPGHVQTAFPQNWLGLDDTEYTALVKQRDKEVPLRRIAQPDDVAHVVCFLASDQSAYLTGLSIPIDGGASA